MKTDKTRRVVAALKDTGLSQNEIARRIGVTPGAVNHWFNESMKKSNVTDQHIPAIAKLTGRTELWLISGVGEEGNVDVVDGDVLSIPMLDARASAGDGLILFEDERILRRIDVDINWLRAQCRFSHPDNLYTITATGDSMSPTIEDGDFLLVDTGIDAIRSDSIYVARVNDCIYVKRFQVTPRGTFLMLSDNARYKEFEVEPEQDQLQVIGKVVYQWHGMPR